jgi:hypothetical protein
MTRELVGVTLVKLVIYTFYFDVHTSRSPKGAHRKIGGWRRIRQLIEAPPRPTQKLLEALFGST